MTNKEKLIDLILKMTNEEAERVVSHLLKEKNRSKTESKPYYHRVIYSIRNNVTGKEYIGKTEDLDKRIKSHMSLLRNGKHNVEDMQSDFDKYGDDFTISVLEEITDYDQRQREYELIESHKSYIRENGYNYKDTVFRRWRGEKIPRRTK